ncbi:hypothetical protein ES708_12303 [subsurface metagenome]
MTEDEQLIMDEEEIRLRFKSTLELITNYTIDSLVRTDELGTKSNFEKFKPEFEIILELYRSLKNIKNLNSIPIANLETLHEKATKTLMNFDKIKRFDPIKTPDSVQARNNLINNIKSNYTETFNASTPLIAYFSTKRIDIEEMLDNERHTITAIIKEMIEQKEKTEQSVSEIQDALEIVRNATAEIGVSQHAAHFNKQANEHKAKTKKWLITTISLAVATLGFGFYLAFFSTDISKLNNVQSIQDSIAKLVIFSVLSTATIWVGKIYKFQWHNYIVNKHRQNALSSFETFVKAAKGDEQTKNAVLLQATQAIFSAQSSGFVSGNEQSTTPQILEIFKGVMGSTGQGA